MGFLILKGTIGSSLLFDITFGVVLRTKYWIYKDSNFGDFPQKMTLSLGWNAFKGDFYSLILHTIPMLDCWICNDSIQFCNTTSSFAPIPTLEAYWPYLERITDFYFFSSGPLFVWMRLHSTLTTSRCKHNKIYNQFILSSLIASRIKKIKWMIKDKIIFDYFILFLSFTL